MDGSTTLLINKCKEYANFMLSEQQWSGLTKAEIDNWIDNFRDLGPSERLLVHKLLTNLIYFSEKDILRALKEGIHNCVCNKIILEKQMCADFTLSRHTLQIISEEEIIRTCFIPLLDSDSPHESGNYVTRMLVQQGIIRPAQSMFVDKLAQTFKSNEIKRLVIVDDCVGSGNQLRDFWRETVVNDGIEIILLRELCKRYNIDAHYLTLFGYDKSILELENTFEDLKIFCVRMLSDAQRVFSNNSYIWRDSKERDDALKLFGSITQECGIPLRGYMDLDFAFIMHQTIPDWSLPMFWKENPDWNLLLRRKNSND